MRVCVCVCMEMHACCVRKGGEGTGLRGGVGDGVHQLYRVDLEVSAEGMWSG